MHSSKMEERFVNTEWPSEVVESNSHMDNVEQCDKLLFLYQISHKILHACCFIAVVNSCQLYKLHISQNDVQAKDQLSLLKFQDR